MQALLGQTHWTPVTGFQSNMVMSAVLYVNGEEQSLNYVEVGAFCGDECRGAELPIELVGEQVYFLTIQGETNDVITFRLWDHQSNEELDYVCEQTYIFVADDVIGEYPDWYPIHFTAPIIYHEVTAMVNPVEGGTVTGAGTYTQGATATLTATANEGYTFVNWTENGEVVSTDNPYSFTVNEATTLTANFTLQTVVIKASAEPAAGGITSGSNTYHYGDRVTISVVPNENWTFRDWTENGITVTEDMTFTFIATANRSFVARLEYTEGIDENDPSTGSEAFTIFPNPIDRNTSYSITLPETETIKNLYVVSMKGEVIAHENDITRMPILQTPGVYTLKVVCRSGKVFLGKLVVR